MSQGKTPHRQKAHASRSSGRIRRLMLCAALTLLVSGCQMLAQTTTPTAATDPLTVACKAFRPVTYSSRDTPQTQLEVRQHNAVYDELCKRPI